jgi:Short C-terminal domain
LSRTFRKSFVAYIGVVLGSLILVFVLAAIASGTSGGASSFFDLLVFLAIVRGIYRIFYLRTVRWVVSPEGLSVAQGILPWRKSYLHAPYETIFEAYYLKSFIGHFLHYGTCGIRRAEGVTSQWQEKRMQGSAELAGLINSRLAALRASMKPGPAAAPAIPAQSVGVDSLSDLVRLKASGDITVEEYERMKARIIGS